MTFCVLVLITSSMHVCHLQTFMWFVLKFIQLPKLFHLNHWKLVIFSQLLKEFHNNIGCWHGPHLLVEGLTSPLLVVVPLTFPHLVTLPPPTPWYNNSFWWHAQWWPKMMMMGREAPSPYIDANVRGSPMTVNCNSLCSFVFILQLQLLKQ